MQSLNFIGKISVWAWGVKGEGIRFSFERFERFLATFGFNSGDSGGVRKYLKGQGLKSPAEMQGAFRRLVVGLGISGVELQPNRVAEIQKGLGEIETDPDRPLPADEDVKERAGEVFRGLRAAGYQDRSIIKLAAELISLLTEDLRDKE